ncbi:hypothetical protein Ddye_003022 [Dipteronia dyeriana]|uniref:Uncharacterized protein n=1 Tax=Dipteronia dyeriana TaxID=168575 RepID=A0AAD9XSS6_9ROSI|nr:hypothetical protein Ddye_003022 [Dipteronia dyeriana]
MITVFYRQKSVIPSNTSEPPIIEVVLLDPRHKQRLLRYCFALLWSEDRANEMTSRVITTLNEIYYQYKVIYFTNVEAVDNIHIANDMSTDDGEIDADSLLDYGYMKLVKETDEIIGAVKDLSLEEN